MCLVTIYQGEVHEASKLMEEVLRFELDLDRRKLMASGFQGAREFEVPTGIVWSEDNDSLIIR